MIDLTIVGDGPQVRSCGDVLVRAGFELHHAMELEADDRSPIILGEVNGAFNIARQAVESGRHLLIANPSALTPDRLGLLMEARKRSQAVFVWSERRYHPGYRFVGGLMEADATWRPRYIRQETLSAEPTTSAAMRWRVLEALGLVIGIAGDAPQTIAAGTTINETRNAPDLTTLRIGFTELEAFIQVGLGEAVERRETLLAAPQRKAFVDEMNQSTPVRLVEDEPDLTSANTARWLSCPSPTPEELARFQCLTFLDATLKTESAQDEANVWLRSITAMETMERSLAASGASLEVIARQEVPRFRVIPGRSIPVSPTSAA